MVHQACNLRLPFRLRLEPRRFRGWPRRQRHPAIFIESFNARLRDELRGGEIFYTQREAEVVIESWRRHYNAVRTHASLDYRAPAPEVLVPPPAILPLASRAVPN